METKETYKDFRSADFIVFEGPDCSGKSTLATQVSNWLTGFTHRKVVHVAEPGTTKLGLEIRKIVKSDMPIDNEALILLFLAARKQLLNEVIMPELMKGHIVVLDRYYISTYVYQAEINENLQERKRLCALVDALQRDLAIPLPSIQFVLDIDNETYIERRFAREGKTDRFETEGIDGFMTAARVIEEYKHCNDPSTVHIDARRSQDLVLSDIIDILSPRVMVADLPAKKKPATTKTAKTNKNKSK